MKERPVFPLTVFYDGACIVCAREMARYRAMDREGRLLFVDVSAPEFDPAPYGMDRDEFMAQMHAMDSEGRVYRAVDAFRAIWQAFPASTLCGFLGAVIALPGINSLARWGYALFARYRHLLPRRDPCQSGYCSPEHRKRG